MYIATLLDRLDRLDQEIIRNIETVGNPFLKASKNRKKSNITLASLSDEKEENSSEGTFRILIVVIMLGWRRFQIAKFRKRIMTWYGEK